MLILQTVVEHTTANPCRKFLHIDDYNHPHLSAVLSARPCNIHGVYAINKKTMAKFNVNKVKQLRATIKTIGQLLRLIEADCGKTIVGYNIINLIDADARYEFYHDITTLTTDCVISLWFKEDAVLCPKTKKEEQLIKQLNERLSNQKLVNTFVKDNLLLLLKEKGYEPYISQRAEHELKFTRPGYNDLVCDAVEYYLNTKILPELGVEVKISRPARKKAHCVNDNDCLIHLGNIKLLTTQPEGE